MSTKVELANLPNGKIALAFSTNREEELQIIDAIRLAIFGDTHKEGGYVNSQRFVIHMDPPQVGGEVSTN